MIRNVFIHNFIKRDKYAIQGRVTFLITLSFFSIITVTEAQSLITGKIVDASSRQPLESVNIEEIGNNKSTALTDYYGNFNIRVNNDTATILASYIGYRPISISVAGKKDLRIEMQPDVVNLKDVVITSSNGQQKFSTLAKVDLDLKPVRNTQELMRLVPGFFVSQHAGGGKAEQIFLRGFDCLIISINLRPNNYLRRANLL